MRAYFYSQQPDGTVTYIPGPYPSATFICSSEADDLRIAAYEYIKKYGYRKEVKINKNCKIRPHYSNTLHAYKIYKAQVDIIYKEVIERYGDKTPHCRERVMNIMRIVNRLNDEGIYLTIP